MEENHQQAAEHYHLMIWTVFSIGAGISIWILYKHLNDGIGILALSFGLVVLIYSFMLIVSFGQQKKIHYEILRGKSERLYGKRYLKVRFMGEIIIGLLLLSYFIFWFDNLKPIPLNTITKSFPAELMSLIIFIIVLASIIYNLKISSTK